MTGWRAHLAALKSRHALAVSADSGSRPGSGAPDGASGTTGANGRAITGAGGCRAGDFPAGSKGAAEALPQPDPAREQAEMAAALAGEASGAFGPPVPEEEHRAAVAGLLRGFAAAGSQPTLEMLA